MGDAEEAAKALVSHLVHVQASGGEIDWSLIDFITDGVEVRALMLHLAVMAAAEVVASATSLDVSAEELWQRQLIERAQS